MNTITVIWWSAGITSAVARKIALEKYPNSRIYYTETGASHPDNERFKKDCEKWYGKRIRTFKNKKGYKSPIDVIKKTGYVNGPDGARCTLELKKEVRFMIEDWYKPSLFNNISIDRQIFGYEFEKKQINRAIRFLEQYPDAHAEFPLIEKGLNKNQCAAILLNNEIALPTMYLLGYGNNNCIGCVKGGMGYWNKIRIDFPNEFNDMAKAERVAGHSCIKGTFLDELEPTRGRETNIVTPECDHFCNVEFADMPDKDLEEIFTGKKSIEELYNAN